MKTIKDNKNKINLILDDGDVLEISTLKENKEHLYIKCINSSLHIEEINVSKIKEKSLEQEQIEKMKKYIKDHE